MSGQGCMRLCHAWAGLHALVSCLGRAACACIMVYAEGGGMGLLAVISRLPACQAIGLPACQAIGLPPCQARRKLRLSTHSPP
eukprot:220298-Chlamydomonas_euryale.AAC.1